MFIIILFFYFNRSQTHFWSFNNSLNINMEANFNETQIILISPIFDIIPSLISRSIRRNRGKKNSLKQYILFYTVYYISYIHMCICILGFPGCSDGKKSACDVGGLGLTAGSGRSSEEGHGNPLHYSCLENPIDWGAWWATVRGVTKSWIQLSN